MATKVILQLKRQPSMLFSLLGPELNNFHIVNWIGHHFIYRVSESPVITCFQNSKPGSIYRLRPFSCASCVKMLVYGVNTFQVRCMCVCYPCLYWFHWILEHWFHEDGEIVAEKALGDEEAPGHRPHQPHQVEGVKTGHLLAPAPASPAQGGGVGETYSIREIRK